MTITFLSIVTRVTNPAAYRVFHQPFEIRDIEPLGESTRLTDGGTISDSVTAAERFG